MPPAWCSTACKNARSDLCCEGCAIRRDGSRFDPKIHTDINDLPVFPVKEFVEEMSPKQRTMCLGIYIEAMVFQAQGRQVQHERYSHYPRGSKLLTVVTSSDICVVP